MPLCNANECREDRGFIILSLSIYQLLLFLVSLVFSPLLLLYIYIRVQKGREQFSRLGERFGFGVKQTFSEPKEKTIWLHAASVGETLALAGVIETLLKETNHNLLLTTTTITASEVLHKRFAEAIAAGRLIHQYNALDFPLVVNCFLNKWQPELSIVCESELWPGRILELSRRCIPQIIVNATMSAKSAKRWAKYPRISRAIFSKFAIILCRNSQIQDYYKSLGAQNTCVTGNLKAGLAVNIDPKGLQILQQLFVGRLVLAAVSTHDAEEALLLEIYEKLRNIYSDLVLFLVPRHPERASQIAGLIEQTGFSFILKSKMEQVDTEQKIDIMLGDTIGDMGLYLSCANIVFIGKSLLAKGGHNPLEAAMLKKPIISGCNIENFAEIYDSFQKNEAVLLVKNAKELHMGIIKLLAEPKLCQQMADNAAKCVENLTGATSKTFAAMQPYLAKLNHAV